MALGCGSFRGICETPTGVGDCPIDQHPTDEIDERQATIASLGTQPSHDLHYTV